MVAPAAAATINVLKPIGTAWLMLNWQSVLIWSILSLFPITFIYLRWRDSTARARSIFDFTLAESLRKGGDGVGALKLYDQILSKSCGPHLLWRAHAGRGQALLMKGDTAQAMVSANKSLALAMEQKKIRDAADAKAMAKHGGAAPDPVVVDDNPDIDPFLTAPISIARLHYERGLISDTLGDVALADADYAAALALEPEKDFVEGYVARRAFDARLKSGKPAAPEVTNSSNNKTKK